MTRYRWVLGSANAWWVVSDEVEKEVASRGGTVVLHCC
jgi:hypothetical protein